MRTVLAALFFFLAAGTLPLAAAADQNFNIQIAEPRVTTLSKADGASVEDEEWKVVTVALPPGGAYARPLRYGDEVIYVLEGTGALKVDGKPTVALTSGTAVALHPKQNEVITNTSLSQALKVLVVQRLGAGRLRHGLAHRGGISKPAEQQTLPNAGLVF